MKTETNELVYQAVDPGLAEKMRNLGCVRADIHTYIRVVHGLVNRHGPIEGGLT